MRQPVKKSGTYQKPRSKTVKKPTQEETAKKSEQKRDKRLPKQHKERKKRVFQHPKYGTSKLEERFARDFLDKLGVKYTYQFEAKSIGRFFDFYIPSCNVLIEVDGDFYHSKGLVYEEMSPMQKRNRRVDEQKNHWAAINCIKLIRIWESDINKSPEGVMEMLRIELESAERLQNIKNEMKKRH